MLWTICWHYKILIFEASLDINGQLRQKVKEVGYTIITLPKTKTLSDQLFGHCISDLHLCFLRIKKTGLLMTRLIHVVKSI